MRARSASAPRDASRERSAAVICRAAARISSISSRPRPAARRATALSDPCSRSIASTRGHLVQPGRNQLLESPPPVPAARVVGDQHPQRVGQAPHIGGHLFVGPQEPDVVGQQVAPMAGLGLADSRPQVVDGRQHVVSALHALAGVGEPEVLPHGDAAGAQQQSHSQQEGGSPEGRNQRRQRMAVSHESGVGGRVAVQLDVQVRGQKTCRSTIFASGAHRGTAGRHATVCGAASTSP